MQQPSQATQAEPSRVSPPVAVKGQAQERLTQAGGRGPAISVEDRRVLALAEDEALVKSLVAVGAEVTVVCWEAATDDTAWLAYRESLQDGWFDAAIIELPPQTWGNESVSSRSVERPQGLQKLPPEIKEGVREANHRVARAAEIVDQLRRVGGAWLVGGTSATSGVLPWALPVWRDLGDVHAVGRFRAAADGIEEVPVSGGQREALLKCVLRHRRPKPPGRLVRVSPYQMTLDGVPPAKSRRTGGEGSGRAPLPGSAEQKRYELDLAALDLELTDDEVAELTVG